MRLQYVVHVTLHERDGNVHRLDVSDTLSCADYRDAQNTSEKLGEWTGPNATRSTVIGVTLFTIDGKRCLVGIREVLEAARQLNTDMDFVDGPKCAAVERD
jgi:hypothetical protein